MPLRLIQKEQELEWFKIYFDKITQNPWPLDDDGDPIGVVGTIEIAGFGLRRLSAGNMMDITNKLHSMTRKGKTQFEYGTATRLKILAACKKAKNIGDAEIAEQEVNPEQEMSAEEIYETAPEVPFNEKVLIMLPNWVSDALLEHINEVNNLTLEDELD